MEIQIGPRLITMSTEALFAFGLYLGTRAGERVPREEVVETFWDSGDEESRRHAMRQMLYRLRKTGVTFAEDSEFLRLDPSLVDSDLTRCLQPGWSDNAAPSEIRAALSMGPTFSSRLSARFLEWFDQVRSRVTQQGKRAAMRALADARAHGNWRDLEEWAGAVITVDQLNEEATLASAEAAAMLGSKGLALEILDQYLAEVAVHSPEASRPALALRKRIAERRSSWVEPGAREIALVGRSEVMARLTAAIESAAAGKGRATLIVASSGFGKSRLLSEAREYAAIRGARTISIRVDALLAAQPWALARELARKLESLPGAASVDPHTMSVVRALLSSDLRHESSLGFAPNNSTGEVTMCIAALISAVSHESKLFIALDDVQNADDLSSEVIGHITSAIDSSRCAIVAAGKAGIERRLRVAGQHAAPHVIRLEPLLDDDVRELARCTAAAYGRDLSLDTLNRITSVAGGHPLFARELALAPATFLEDGTLPASLSDAVDRNLAAQTPEALRILRLVALLGDTSTVGRVQRTAQLESATFLSAIESLSNDGVLALDSTRTIRLHDSWRAAVLASMPRALSAALALECADSLEREADLDDFATQSRMAELLGLAGESHRALKFRLASIDSLLAAGLYASALNQLAHETDRPLSPETRARFRARQALGVLAVGRPAEALELAESVWRSRVLHSSDHLSEHALAVGVSADCHTKLDMADSGPAEELLSLARNPLANVGDRARSALWGTRLASNATDTSRLHDFTRALRELGRQADGLPAAALTELIHAAEVGTHDDLRMAFDRVRSLDRSDLSVADQCHLLRCLSHALRIASLVDDAIATGRSAFQLSERHGLAYSARVTAELLCHISLDFLRIEEAAEWLRAAEACEVPSHQGVTQTSLPHTHDRLLHAQGRYCEAATRIEGRLPTIRRFGRTSGRTSELALAALAFSQSERTHDAREILSEVLVEAPAFVGRFMGDFIFDTALQAAKYCDLEGAAAPIAREHMLARMRAQRPAVAPAFQALATLERSVS